MNTKIRFTDPMPFTSIPNPNPKRFGNVAYSVRISEDTSTNPHTFSVVAFSSENHRAETSLSMPRPTQAEALKDFTDGFDVCLTGNDHNAQVIRALIEQGDAVVV